MKTLQTYRLKVIAPDPGGRWVGADERVLANLPALIEEVEENTTDLLPEGYSIQIEEEHKGE